MQSESLMTESIAVTALMEECSAKDTPAGRFNLASLYFHIHEYDTCRGILQAIFAQIEDIHDIQVKICFLYLEVLLRLHTLRNIYSYEEHNSFILITQQIFHVLSQSKELSEAPTLIRHIIEFRIHLYRCRVLALQRNQMRGCRREIKNAIELFQHNLRPILEGSKNLSEEGILKGISLETANQLALNLKADLENGKANYKKALKLLSSANLKEPDTYIGQNNVACIYFKMGKFAAASLFFHEATQLLLRQAPDGRLIDASNTMLRHSYAADVIYNHALSLLHAKEPREALRLFSSLCASYMELRPTLWLRMGECCISLYSELTSRSSKRGLVYAGNKS